MTNNGPIPIGETPEGDEYNHEQVAPELQEFGAAALDSRKLQRARVRSIALAIFLLALTAVLGAALVDSKTDPWFQPLDDQWRSFIFDYRSPPATFIAETLSVIGSVYVTVPLRAGVLVVLAVRKRWTQLGAFATALVSSELLIGSLKSFFDRPRPPDPMVLATSAAFPSGHAIAAAVTAFGIVAAFLPRGTRRWHWIIVASAIASVMSLSRTYLSVHWATDTIAGTAIGVACAVLAEALFEGGRHSVALEHVPDLDSDVIQPKK